MIREELYKQFGPKLIEAVVIVMKDEINIIRSSVGLPERSGGQVMIAVRNKLESLANYE